MVLYLDAGLTVRNSTRRCAFSTEFIIDLLTTAMEILQFYSMYNRKTDFGHRGLFKENSWYFTKFNYNPDSR